MEILITIIFEGALESITAKKIPVFIRVIAAVVLLTFYVGFGGLLVYIGIINNSGIMIGISIFFLALVAYVAFKKYSELINKDK